MWARGRGRQVPCLASRSRPESGDGVGHDAIPLSPPVNFPSARGIGSTLLAEGVETADEYHALRELGIHLFQGYLFGRPALERLEPIADSTWAALAHAAPRAGCG